MNGRSLSSPLVILALITATEPAFAQEQSGRPVPTQPFPLFHNPTDQFVPAAPGTTRIFVFRGQQNQPAQPSSPRPSTGQKSR